MATAQSCTVTRTVEVGEAGIALTLTVEEAEVLAEVLGRVAGPMDGRRGKAEGVFNALLDAGVEWDWRANEETSTGSVRFLEAY